MSGLKDAFYQDRLAAYPNQPGYQRNSDTSRAAAESMARHFNKQQQRIIDWLFARGFDGGTYSEICHGTSLSAPSVCGRMVELCEAKAVIKSEHTRATPSGRQAHVYLHKDFSQGGAS